MDPPKDIAYPKAIPSGDIEAMMAMWDKNPVSQEFLTYYNRFALKSTQAIASLSSDNLIYSPISLYFPLMLNLEGSGGTTREELKKVLYADNENIAEQMSHLYTRLYLNNDTGYTAIANSLWVHPDVKVNDAFMDTAIKDFYTAVYSRDMSLEHTRKEMGAWVKAHTNGGITPIIEPNEGPVQILNTISLKMKWATPFDKKETSIQKFYVKDTEAIEVPFMKNRFESSFFQETDAYVEYALPMHEDYKLHVILPNKDMTPYKVLKDPNLLQDVLNQKHLQEGDITLHMPKVELHSKVSLKKPLYKLGIQQMFQSNADFTNMSKQTPLFVGDIQQEALISWDEEGVEASAFTREIMCTSAPPKEKRKLDINLNRPFIYVIEQKIDKTSIPLFIGICDHPLRG